MKLIPNWRSAWRMATVQLASCGIAFGLLPPEMQSAILEAAGVPASRVTAVLGVLVLLGRIVAQPAVTPPAFKQTEVDDDGKW